MTENHSSDLSKAFKNRWRRRCILLLALWLLSLLLLTSPGVRSFVSYPLYVNDEAPRGDAAYVMADGFAYWERLLAASDLYNMKRVPRIIILDEQEPDRYNFVKQRSDMLVDRAIDYLEWHGVPRDKIATVPVNPEAWFGSLSEAQSVAKAMPDLKSIVVVTSAAHTRRSLLCFRRSLPEDVRVQVFAPGPPSQSWEIGSPIWIEYAKLLVYYVVA